MSRPESKRRPRRSVQFAEKEAEVVAEVESCFDFPEDIRRDLWHSREEYHFARSSARVIAKESERYGHSRHLDGAYVDSVAPQVQDALKIWCLHGHSRRGLERWSNSVHGNVRKNDQYSYLHGILRAQAEMKLKEEYSEERLREVSVRLSRKAKVFAEMLGQADNHAAQWELGMIDARSAVSPRQRRKNLGLSGNPTEASQAVAPPSHAVRRTAASIARRTTDTRVTTPKITIRARPGRVPRMA